MALIYVADLVKEYQSGTLVTPVLRGVSFAIESGEFIAIMGPSGSGKSTLMHILGFLDRQTSGQYVFEERETTSLEDDDLAVIRSTRVGFVFQAFNLLARATALENVCLPLVYAGVSPAEQRRRGMDVLASLGLSDRAHHRPNELSGGQQQRVAIARALINNPAVIFADEPTGNLDTKASYEIMRILQALNDDGRTIVLVTHEEDIGLMTKRRLMIVDGMIQKDEAVVQRRA